MSIYDNIKEYLGIKPVQSYVAYCQNCGRDVTNEGADVSTSGSIYCHGYDEDGSRCFDKEIKKMFEGSFTHVVYGEFYKPAELQKEIRKMKVTHYGPLEKKSIA